MTDQRDPSQPADEAAVDEAVVDEAASDESAPEPDPAPAPVETEWQRRKRIAAAFGDVLPDTTGDERGGSGKSDDWYRDQVPPHHG